MNRIILKKKRKRQKKKACTVFWKNNFGKKDNAKRVKQR